MGHATKLLDALQTQASCTLGELPAQAALQAAELLPQAPLLKACSSDAHVGLQAIRSSMPSAGWLNSLRQGFTVFKPAQQHGLNASAAQPAVPHLFAAAHGKRSPREAPVSPFANAAGACLKDAPAADPQPGQPPKDEAASYPSPRKVPRMDTAMPPPGAGWDAMLGLSGGVAQSGLLQQNAPPGTAGMAAQIKLHDPSAEGLTAGAASAAGMEPAQAAVLPIRPLARRASTEVNPNSHRFVFEPLEDAAGPVGKPSGGNRAPSMVEAKQLYSIAVHAGTSSTGRRPDAA
jgi:hypothetical protein